MTTEIRKLGDIARVIMGLSPKGNTYNDEGLGLPLLNGPTEFGPHHPNCSLFTTDSKRICEQGDLIFCVRGSTTGRMNWADRPYSLGRGVCAIRGKTNADTKFIGYCLDIHLESLLKLAGGGTFPNLRQEDITGFVIPYPIDRDSIVTVLSSYDDLIENNRRRIQLLEEMARALYREWFVHFRFPGHEDVEMVDSELGEIPQSWSVLKLENVADVHRGRSYRSKNLVESGGLPFLNLKCIDRDGGFRPDGLKRYDGEFNRTQVAEPGDVVVAVTDMTQERRVVARAARVPIMDESEFVLSMDLVKIEAKNHGTSDYIYGLLRFSRFPDEVKEYANGVNVLHLSPDFIRSFKFECPPVKLQQDYSYIVSKLYSLQDFLNRQISSLSNIRDFLLPKLVSGEIDVSNLRIEAPPSTHKTSKYSDQSTLDQWLDGDDNHGRS